jgi:hypothetical protein
MDLPILAHPMSKQQKLGHKQQKRRRKQQKRRPKAAL